MAGITHIKELQTPALMGLSQALSEERDATPTLADRFLPNRNVFSTQFAYDIIKKNAHIAAYIGYGAEPPVMDRDAVASKAGELAKLGIKYIATEEELLALNQARSNAEKTAMVDALLTRASDLVDAIQKQISLSKLQALLTGEFTYNKNGAKFGIDFGVPAENKKEQTGTAAWDTATGTPITDLIAWNDEYVAQNGNADVIILSRDVLRVLQTNPEVLSEAGVTTGRATVEQVQDVLNSYGLPAIEVVSQRTLTYHDIYSGETETVEYMPKYRVVFAQEGIGAFLLGPTVENNYQPGIALSSYDKQEPIQSVIRAAAAGFPVIENPFAILFADVAAD